MTKLYACAVMDGAVQAFAPPFFVPQVAVAIRSFTDEVNNPRAESMLGRHPEDYTLVCLAVFDDESGAFESVEGTRRVLVRGKDVKQGG